MNVSARAFFLAKQIVNQKVSYEAVVKKYPNLKIEIDACLEQFQANLQ